MAIATEIIDEIRQRADIVEVIGEFVSLKKKGANWWGCCPFHNEKTGSFSVSPARQIYKCFGCGKGGNVFTFLQEHEQLTFPEAVRWLGKKYNIDVPERELTAEEREREYRRESLQAAIRAGNSFFRGNLTDRRAVDYLSARGFTPGDVILDAYQIGYAPAGNGLLENVAKQGYSISLLEDVGLVATGERGMYDWFRSRITFPFLSITGNVVGFTGRDVSGNTDVKYSNTRETELFHKGAVLFGIYQAKKEIGAKDKVYLVEGQFDVLSFVKAGIANTVCGSGTALTPSQVKMLLRFTNNVTLIYDADKAGEAAMRKNIGILVEQGAAVRCVVLPDGDDPDTFARKMNPADLEKYLKNREIDFASYLAMQAKDSFGDPEHYEQALQEITSLIARLKNETRQAAYVKNVAKIFDAAPEIIWKKVRAAGRDIPVEDDIQAGFYGIEEAQALLEETSEDCILTCSFDVFTKHFGDSPVVYFKGQVAKDKIQNFRRLIDCVEFRDCHTLRIGDQQESPQLLLLKELFKAGVTINVIAEQGSTGFVQHYVKMYKSILPSVTETVRAVYVDRCAELISFASETVRTVMASDWAKDLDLKITQYKEILKPYLAARKSKSMINTQRGDLDEMLMAYDPDKIPDYVNENEEYKRVYHRHGFYPLLNKEGTPVCYMFKSDKGGHIQVGDFHMTPLLHIYDQEAEYNKRVIRIDRLYAKQPIYLEVKSKSLASLQGFEEILLNEEALNFENGELRHFKKIRQAMSYNYTKCNELKIFGQQNENFFAFANAIFHEVDGVCRIDYANDLGVVTHDGQNYYTPAYSKIYSNMRKDSDKYEQHRFFTFKDIPPEQQCSFEEWAALMDEVYKVNDNGKWAVIYAIMCAFRSDIHVIDRLFTALFFVGPTMSGKTQVAISIRSLYVDPRAPSFNLNNGTDAAFFTLMEGFRDVPQVLEEYNNKDISKEKFQGLKAIVYDGDGKQKRKGISDRDIDTSKVNSPVVILGQETPERDDNALMNRAVLCEVPKRNEEYTARETAVFQKLKEYEKNGLCNVLFEILKLRPIVRANFKALERQVNKELTEAVLIGSEASGDMVRIIKTVSLFLTMCRLLEDYAPGLKLPFTYKEFFGKAAEKVKWQIELISHTDKLAGFFKAIEVMINIGSIKEGREYSISQPGKLTLKAGGNEIRQMPLQPDTKVLFIRLSNLYALYAKSSYNTENATLSTIGQNLRSNPAYIGEMSSKKFKWMESKEVPKSAISGSMEMVRVMEEKTQTTSCIALNYDVFRKYFDIDLERDCPPDGLKECSTDVLF